MYVLCIIIVGNVTSFEYEAGFIFGGIHPTSEFACQYAHYNNLVCHYGWVILEILILIITRKMYRDITKYPLNIWCTIGHTPKCFIGIKQCLKHTDYYNTTSIYKMCDFWHTGVEGQQ